MEGRLMYVLATCFILSIPVSVIALNIDESDAIAEKACGSQRPAILTEPGVPFRPLITENGTYEENLTCHWLIRAPPGSVVRLEFPLIEMEWKWPCAYANLSVFDNDAIEKDHYLEHFCGNATAPTMHSSHEDLFVVFLSGIKARGRGFIANYTFIQMQETACSPEGPFEMTSWQYGGFTTPNWPEFYPSLSSCMWQITAENPIRMEFIDFQLEPPEGNKGCIYDNLTVYDINVPIDNVIGVFCDYIIPDPIGSIGQSLLVIFKSNDDRRHSGIRVRFEARNITEWACINSRPAEIDFAPGLIESPKSEESNCHWRLQAPLRKLIKMRIRTFDLPECYQCGCAGLDVYDGDTHLSPKIGRYCGSGWLQDELLFGGANAYLEYDSYMLAPNEGFVIEYEYFDTAEVACGSGRPLELTHFTGYITSPNYDKDDYPANSNCQWVVKATFGYVVLLEFVDFHLEECYGCQCDFLSVYNGDWPQDSQRINSYCGTETIFPIYTTQPDAYLTFVSDSTYNYPGFNIRYTHDHLATRACRAELVGPAEMSYEPGTILSVGYEDDQYYHPNSRCEWLITSSNPVKRIVLEVLDLDIEGGAYCEFDSLSFYDGYNVNEKRLAKLCGDDKKTIKSTGNAMYVVFTSNEILEGKGFHLEYVYENREQDKDLPWFYVLLICLAVVFVIALVCTFCGFSAKIKRIRDRLLGRTTTQSGRATNATEMTNRACVVQSPPYDSIDHDFPSIAQVSRPPSQVDDQEYFAIANYPPPTYDEAMSQASQQDSQSSASTEIRRTNIIQSNPNPVINENNRLSSQSNFSMNERNTTGFRDVQQYPLQLQRQTSQNANVSSRNSRNMGNADIGDSILRRAGILGHSRSSSLSPSQSSGNANRLPNETVSPVLDNRTSRAGNSAQNIQTAATNSNSRRSSNVSRSQGDYICFSPQGSTPPLQAESRSNISNERIPRVPDNPNIEESQALKRHDRGQQKHIDPRHSISDSGDKVINDESVSVHNVTKQDGDKANTRQNCSDSDKHTTQNINSLMGDTSV